jgi:hypothetical protein
MDDRESGNRLTMTEEEKVTRISTTIALRILGRAGVTERSRGSERSQVVWTMDSP